MATKGRHARTHVLPRAWQVRSLSGARLPSARRRDKAAILLRIGRL